MDDKSLDSHGAESVPSGDYANGLEVLASRLARADRVQIAVAFVSLSGVRLLGELLANERQTSIEVVARGADATSPDALISLQDDLGATVSAVMGKDARTFHPKLWLIRNPECLTVMSGSGNLTRGGLVANQEQFEVLEIDPESDEAQAQEERFDLLTSKGKTLNPVELAHGAETRFISSSYESTTSYLTDCPSGWSLSLAKNFLAQSILVCSAPFRSRVERLPLVSATK